MAAEQDIEICTVTQLDELQQIVDLQTANHYTNVSAAQAASQGYVTVRHTLEMLEQMNAIIPQVIAKHGTQVVGYALTMTLACKDIVPALIPLFELADQLEFKNKRLADYRYYVMGQVCVADGYRGMGIFDKLYARHKELFSNDYDLLLTEIATKNSRSHKAHKRVGFQIIHTHTDPYQLWDVVVWDWN